MNPTDEDTQPADLGKKLEELESLIENGEVEQPATKIQVPVLDELVTEEDFAESEKEEEDDTELVEAQIKELAEKLEDKFSGELDQVVKLLKDNLKNSIVEELRTQANLDSKPELENAEPPKSLDNDSE